MNINTGIHPYSRLGGMEALEGAVILERKLDVASHNMANLKTTAYKKQGITFEEYMLKQVDDTDRTAKGETLWGDFSQGTIHKTDNPYDFAIKREGYFVVQTPNGNLYTRAGNFTLNDQYQLVTKEGYPVLADGAPIELQDTTGKNIWLTEDGYFFIDERQGGRLDVVTFNDEQQLTRLGKNLFQATEGSGEPQPNPDRRIAQGFIEDSNVDPVKSMINLIDLYRGYETQQKTLQAVDQINDKAVNQTGRVA